MRSILIYQGNGNWCIRALEDCYLIGLHFAKLDQDEEFIGKKVIEIANHVDLGKVQYLNDKEFIVIESIPE